ncbi:hypothetical protein [Undibacterium sp. Xuan67W]|uniref:hypothetical protein n=1 Tax=Undibacterium sp. Xuan67W TaxID=3413057 RepID=UPI003BF2178D
MERNDLVLPETTLQAREIGTGMQLSNAIKKSVDRPPLTPHSHHHVKYALQPDCSASHENETYAPSISV